MLTPVFGVTVMNVDRFAFLTGVLALTMAWCSCSSSRDGGPSASRDGRLNPSAIPMPDVAEETPRDYPGIHNAVAFHDGFVSGSAPEGEEGFETLASMGVRTIISVDGAEPEVERADAHGMRYIHLPIGYNGFDEQRKLQLVRATRDAMKNGPVYIHCHHGKHRSAGAAAAIAASLGWLSPEDGVARMHVSGTSANYSGLYACAGRATKLASSTVDEVPSDFPSVWKPSNFVKGMVEVDEVFERLKAVEKAGWTTPADHPDLVPAGEAGRLADLFRMLNETDYVGRKPSEFATMMHEADATAQALEDLLAGQGPDHARLGAQLKLVTASCKSCHTKFRD
jgi:protein tyrosine phosphatase (PTP) superfamily phosphohydrolase (DUF442 family)